MSDLKMDVFLLGTPQPGVARSALVSNLAAVFKKDVPTIEKMLRRPRILIKEAIEPTLAEKYKTLIENAGGQCEVTEHGKTPEPLPNESPKARDLTLEPIVSKSASEEDENEDEYEDSAGGSFCATCGGLIRIEQTKCPKCSTLKTGSVRKSKATAGTLAFFIGGLGVHRIYLGQWWGLLYLIFWCTLIPSIISIFEAIVFWLSPRKKWDEKYGHAKKFDAFMAVILICGFFIFIMTTGILAAVALPAYQDYANRAKIQSATPQIIDAKNKVASFILTTHIYPSENAFAHLPDTMTDKIIESIKLQEGGKLEVTYRITSLRDKNTIVWIPKEENGQVSWTCKEEGTMLDRYRPIECRDSNRVTKQHSSIVYSDDKHISLKLPAE